MTRDAHISFGLNCVAMALRAKLGVVARGEPMNLILIANDLVPDDAPAGKAVAEFAKKCVCDQAAAGAELHDFILNWQGGCIQRQIKPQRPKHFAWQDRADLR